MPEKANLKIEAAVNIPFVSEILQLIAVFRETQDPDIRRRFDLLAVGFWEDLDKARRKQWRELGWIE